MCLEEALRLLNGAYLVLLTKTAEEPHQPQTHQTLKLSPHFNIPKLFSGNRSEVKGHMLMDCLQITRVFKTTFLENS